MIVSFSLKWRKICEIYLKWKCFLSFKNMDGKSQSHLSLGKTETTSFDFCKAQLPFEINSIFLIRKRKTFAN